MVYDPVYDACALINEPEPDWLDASMLDVNVDWGDAKALSFKDLMYAINVLVGKTHYAAPMVDYAPPFNIPKGYTVKLRSDVRTIKIEDP
jgi:hypothetical protein